MTPLKILIGSLFLLIHFQTTARDWFMTNVDGDMQTFEQCMEAHQVNGSGYVVVRLKDSNT